MSADGPRPARSVWLSPRSVAAHVVLALIIPGFLLLFLWQVRRATSGNELSWAYVFEWPFFLAYAVYMWWRLVHEPTAEPAGHPGPAGTESESPERDRPTGGAARGDAAPEDPELAAYNDYLAHLHESGRPKHW